MKKEGELMKYSAIDSILSHTQELLTYHRNNSGNVDGNNDFDKIILPNPIMFKLDNPLARFSCNPNNKELLAKSAAESIYLLSGMNGVDFIYPFRGLVENVKKYEKSLGAKLRFLGLENQLLDYSYSSSLRQKVTNTFEDQLAGVINRLESKKYTDAVVSFSSTKEILMVHLVKFSVAQDKLNMLIFAGSVDSLNEFYTELIAPFTFLQQIVSTILNIPLGNSQFVIENLYAHSYSLAEHIRNFKTPIINMHDFQYPKGSLTLRDIDTLVSIMVEFVGRLDENNLNRANPFERDDRVMLFSDYAEIFRVWKAEQLGYKVEMEQCFYHPQLRFIYKGETI